MPVLTAIEDNIQELVNTFNTYSGTNIIFERGDHIYGGYSAVPPNTNMKWEDYWRPDLPRVELQNTPPQMAENLYLFDLTNDVDLSGLGDCLLWCYIILNNLLSGTPIPNNGVDAYNTVKTYIDAILRNNRS
jgi:hypothetical protein